MIGLARLPPSDMATPLLFEVFNSIDYNTSNDWFTTPEGLDFRLVCSEIIEKEGQQFAVVKGDLVRTGTNSVYMKFKLADGTKSDTRKIQTKPEFRAMVDGKPVSVRNLAVGQELTAYVKVSDPVIALEPATDEALVLTPIEPAAPMVADNSADMPHTASALPTAAGLGALLLAFAGMLTFLRVRRES